jgi:ribosomal-protein-alanine N-acetyltransferase
MACREIPLEFARLRDAEAVALLSRDLIETGLRWSYRPERIAQMIADRETVALVARDAAPVAGFRDHGVRRRTRASRADGRAPSHQRRGIARRMLGWLVESAEVAGMASIHVELRADNSAAYALYDAMGFVETLRERGYYQGRETAVRMMRLLRAPGSPSRRGGRRRSTGASVSAPAPEASAPPARRRAAPIRSHR